MLKTQNQFIYMAGVCKGYGRKAVSDSIEAPETKEPP
jgi:hypothetical protein